MQSSTILTLANAALLTQVNGGYLGISAMRTEELSFPGASGEQLAARLDLPLDGAPLAYALFAHCFTCGKNLAALAAGAS